MSASSSSPPPDRPAPSRPGDPERDLQGALHDVANALTVVLGTVEMAIRDIDPQDPVSESLDLARMWARHGRGIALRAMGADRANSDDVPEQLGELIRTAVDGVRPQALTRRIHVESIVPADLEQLRVRAAPMALQVMANLLFNAAAFSGPGTQVEVEASRDHNKLKLIVSDEGPGFRPEQKTRVFEGLPSARQGGSGVGLRYSRLVAESQGGTLTLLESMSGACFELLWPLADDVPQPRSNRSNVTRLTGKRILVLDDDTTVLMLLETGLQARGAEVVSARNVSSLARALTTGGFDAALVDLSPLGPDPADLLRMIRTGNPGLRLVLISGSATPPPGEAMEAASAWVRKPFEVAEIVAAIAGDFGSSH